MISKPKLVYCSWSEWKKEEWDVAQHFPFEHSLTLGDALEFEFRKVRTSEPLLRNLGDMVREKAISAYYETNVPCVVEHAGLILEGYESENYPGGLTQPMWDALGAEKFSAVCRMLSGKAIARAVIGYCDGSDVHVFTGEMSGTITDKPAGSRAFYWDTIFCPDGFSGKTYAEIADHDLSEKLSVSQSIKALRKLIAHRRAESPPLFPGI